MTFAELFKSLRGDLGLNQEEMAAILKISQGTLSKIEAGKLIPPSPIFLKANQMRMSRSVRMLWSDFIKLGKF